MKIHIPGCQPQARALGSRLRQRVASERAPKVGGPISRHFHPWECRHNRPPRPMIGDMLLGLKTKTNLHSCLSSPLWGLFDWVKFTIQGQNNSLVFTIFHLDGDLVKWQWDWKWIRIRQTEYMQLHLWVNATNTKKRTNIHIQLENIIYSEFCHSYPYFFRHVH